MRYINSDVGVLVNNIRNKINDPVYAIYDENWNLIEHTSAWITDGPATLRYQKGTPRRVFVETEAHIITVRHNTVFIWEGGRRCIPSSRGMYREPPEPIFMDGKAFVRVSFSEAMAGFCDPSQRDPLWIEGRGDCVAGT